MDIISIPMRMRIKESCWVITKLKGLCTVYKVSSTNFHVTAAKAAVTSVLANNLRQRLFHVTQNIVWLHNSA